MGQALCKYYDSSHKIDFEESKSKEEIEKLIEYKNESLSREIEFLLSNRKVYEYALIKYKSIFLSNSIDNVRVLRKKIIYHAIDLEELKKLLTEIYALENQFSIEELQKRNKKLNDFLREMTDGEY